MKRNKQLDSLRASSISLVLVAHLGFEQIVPGGLGVTTFFVISGFIISSLIIKEYELFQNVNVLLFYKRRFWKIAPPLFFLITVPNLIMWQQYSISPIKFISQLLFFFNWTKIYSNPGNIAPTSGVTWSLSIEEQFYIGIAIVIVLIQKFVVNIKLFTKVIAAIYLMLWIISTTSRFAISYQGGNSSTRDMTGNLNRIYFGTDTRLSSICAGGLLATLITNDTFFRFCKKIISESRSLFFYLGIGILLLSLLIRNNHFRDTFRFTLQELAVVFLILCGPVLNMWPKWVQAIAETKFVQLIGISSYCLYLSHPLVISFLNYCQTVVEVNPNKYLWSLFVGMISILIGYLCYRIFDAPFENMRDKARRN